MVSSIGDNRQNKVPRQQNVVVIDDANAFTGTYLREPTVIFAHRFRGMC